MNKSSTFFSGIAFGIVFCLILAFYARTGASLLSFLGPLTDPRPMIRCATQVDATSWKMYSSAKQGFSFRYPSSYVLQEETGSSILNITNGISHNEITLEKIRGSLKKELLPDMRQAGWKVADRQVYALATPNFTNDDGSLSSTYLFIRDFPLHEDSGNYIMVRATIRTSAGEFDSAKQAHLVDPEAILTEPEQILSTFRFLQFDELPGADGGSAS